MKETAKIISVNVSERKGVKKSPVPSAQLEIGQGVVGDGHGDDSVREVSLLAMESIDKMTKKGLDVGPGDFAENITTEGIDLVDLPIGSELKLGEGAILQISKIGKECHKPCAIKAQAGECVMPSEGIFAKVIIGGKIKAGDRIEVIA